MPSNILPTELAKLLQSGKCVNLIDVRSPAEFEQMHLNAACNIPLHELDAEFVRGRYSNDQVYVICQRGGRGRKACKQLEAAGLSNVANIEGGAEAWVAAGLPVVRGRQVMSLERQVRIVAGSLVLFGILLAGAVHTAFIGLSAFVGAGLLFSGVSDTCGMGLLLARMPWNKAKPAACGNTTVVESSKANPP